MQAAQETFFCHHNKIWAIQNIIKESESIFGGRVVVNVADENECLTFFSQLSVDQPFAK